MVNLAILFGRPRSCRLYGSRQDDVGGRLQVYYMTRAFHRMLGLGRMERIDFANNDINRAIVAYSNGARLDQPKQHGMDGGGLPPSAAGLSRAWSGRLSGIPGDERDQCHGPGPLL